MPCVRTVLQDQNEQLTQTMRTNILSAALVYVTANSYIGPRKPLSSSNYIAYKKAQIISASKPTVRPPQTVIITELQNLPCLT